MKRTVFRTSKIVRFFKPNYLPTCIALMIVVTAGIFAEQQNRAVHAARARWRCRRHGEQFGSRELWV
jgi:sensor domain CHASE-containing protein